MIPAFWFLAFMGAVAFVYGFVSGDGGAVGVGVLVSVVGVVGVGVVQERVRKAKADSGREDER